MKEVYGITQELVERITDAENEMLKREIQANTIVINGRRYAPIINGKYLPFIAGLKAEVEYELPDDVDFILIQRPDTRADQIRKMTDEQLAEFFEKYLGCVNCPKFDECSPASFAADSRLSCAGYMYDWLTEEAEPELQKEN